MTQPDWQTCTNCRQNVPADAAVCGFCGHRLKALAVDQPTSVQPVAPNPVAEQPMLAQPVATIPVVEQSQPPAPFRPIPEPPGGAWPASRALGATGAFLAIISSTLPWLAIGFVRSHRGFDIAWSDLISGNGFPGGRPTFQGVGFAILLLGIAALWWVLTDRHAWLRLLAGVGVLVIAIGVAVQVAITVVPQLETVFEILDIGFYAATIAAILLIAAGLSDRST